MKKRIIWLVMTCLMAAALVLTSCAEAVTEKEEEITPPKKEAAAPPKEEEKVAPVVVGPRYGGVYIEGRVVDEQHFDEASLYIHTAGSLKLTNEDLLMGDWAKGPAGTNEASWLYHAPVSSNLIAGCLAESWEFPDPDTCIFHIRKGVRWHDKPPVNGRELTADDVVYSLKRVWTIPSSYTRMAYLWDTHIESMTAPDKYTFVLKCLPGKLGLVFPMLTDHHRIIPPEMYPEDETMKDWENTCGTGPFMLVDRVSGSSMTFERNPNYWGSDPAGPGKGNQLPYLDGVKWLVLPDASTRMAALRTAKIDWLAIGWEEAKSVMETNPELKYLKWFGGAMTAIAGKLDTPPFDDIRVRHALSMAIDNQEIADLLYGGDAVMLGFPIPPTAEWKHLYIPVNELAEETRQLYGYHPDKAKQILAEAGYPDGFKINVVTFSYPTYMDLLPIVQDYWAKIGVELEIDVKEYGVYASMGLGTKKSFTQLYTAGVTATGPFRFYHETPGKTPNYSLIDDPVINEAFATITAAWPDFDKQSEIYSELLPHTLYQNYYIQLPTSFTYTFWQPWIKNYHAEYAVGYANQSGFPKYIWLDQDLKEKMTGRR